MPGGNFDEQLQVRGGFVQAGGPLDPVVRNVTIMCVWVFQPDGQATAPAKQGDAVGNAMGPPGAGMPGMGLKVTINAPGTPGRWDFPLTDRLDSGDFRDGAATALAIGVFRDGADRQRTFVWAEAVTLAGVGGKSA